MQTEFKWEVLRGKRPLRRHSDRWEDSFKMDLKEVGCDARNWMDVDHDRDQWRAYVRAAVTLHVH